MEMAEYKPNSNKYKEEQRQQQTEEKKKVEKVVKGVVKVKKKNELRKFADIFVSEDVGNVGSYVFMEVLVPAIKKAISDIVTDGIDMILYGSPRKHNRGSGVANVSYRSYYDRDKRDDHHRDENPRTRTGYNYDDIVLESLGEANEVIDQMGALIETYGMVSVADLYDLVGKSCNYTDNKYGWTNISNAEAIRVRDGYLLKLPKAAPLKL